jgi:subtilisin
VDKAKSHDYQGESQLVRPHETHGTQVPGIIAARDNSLGMRGVAPRATIYSYNILADQYTLENAVDALTRNMDTVAVSNNSWTSAQTWRYQRLSGFYDLALDAGVTRGYGSKGIFYVFAAGNDGAAWSSYSNNDEFLNYCAVTTIEH